MKLVTFSALLVLTLGCSKQEQTRTESGANDLEEKIITYLQITTNTPKEEIGYNETKDSLILKGWYKVSVKEIQKQYNQANEYKNKYEKPTSNENN